MLALEGVVRDLVGENVIGTKDRHYARTSVMHESGSFWPLK